jgi:hypothetical protein
MPLPSTKRLPIPLTLHSTTTPTDQQHTQAHYILSGAHARARRGGPALTPPPAEGPSQYCASSLPAAPQPQHHARGKPRDSSAAPAELCWTTQSTAACTNQQRLRPTSAKPTVLPTYHRRQLLHQPADAPSQPNNSRPASRRQMPSGAQAAWQHITTTEHRHS